MHSSESSAQPDEAEQAATPGLRLLQLLELVCAAPEPQTLVDVVRLSGQPKPSVQSKTQNQQKKPTTITCAKAGEIVSGYGFKSVESVTCKGQVYAFNATRDGKPFSVKLNSASGELTEVKKR